jgi:hypothetical protein
MSDDSVDQEPMQICPHRRLGTTIAHKLDEQLDHEHHVVATSSVGKGNDVIHINLAEEENVGALFIANGQVRQWKSTNILIYNQGNFIVFTLRAGRR